MRRDRAGTPGPRPQVTLTPPSARGLASAHGRRPERARRRPADRLRAELRSGPCGPARAEVDVPLRRGRAAGPGARSPRQQRLRDAKRDAGGASSAQRDADARVRDRRALSDARTTARARLPRALHARQAAAPSASAGRRRRVAARDRPPQPPARAGRSARRPTSTRQVAELERGAARDRARRGRRAHRRRGGPGRPASRRAARLAACEEDAARRVRDRRQRPGARRRRRRLDAAGAAPPVARRARPSAAAQAPAPISLLLRGDRQALLGADRCASPRRPASRPAGCSCCCSSCARRSSARALEDGALAFPADHPFWSQFSADDGRQLAASLAATGLPLRRPRGLARRPRAGLRELAMALATRATTRARCAGRPARPRSTRCGRARRCCVEEYLAAARAGPRAGPADRAPRAARRAARASCGTCGAGCGRCC